MAQKKSAADEHAISFLGVTRQYQKAANLLCEADKTLRRPTYFLYLHTIELTLKAFLRAHDISIVSDGRRKHHKVTELYEECRNLGLRIGSEDTFDIGNVVVMLEGANEEQGLRYFKTKSASMPSLDWCRDVVEDLLQAVGPSVKKKAEAGGIVEGRAVRLEFTFGRPGPKDLGKRRGDPA